MKDKKVLILEIIIGIIFISAIALVWFFNTPTANSSETVDMGYFNKTIEELNTKIGSMQTDIDTLKSTNVDLQEQVRLLNEKSNSLQTQINNTINGLSNSNNKITKLQNWNKALYTALINNYTNYGIAKYMLEFEKTA